MVSKQTKPMVFEKASLDSSDSTPSLEYASQMDSGSRHKETMV